MPEKTSKRPTHTVRLLPAPDADPAPWPFVGAAWVNRDGSLNIVIDKKLPVGARVQVRERKPVSS